MQRLHGQCMQNGEAPAFGTRRGTCVAFPLRPNTWVRRAGPEFGAGLFVRVKCTLVPQHVIYILDLKLRKGFIYNIFFPQIIGSNVLSLGENVAVLQYNV